MTATDAPLSLDTVLLLIGIAGFIVLTEIAVVTWLRRRHPRKDNGDRLAYLHAPAVRHATALADVLGVTIPEAIETALSEALTAHEGDE